MNFITEFAQFLPDSAVWLQMFVSMTLKGTLVLCTAFFAAFLLRKRSAVIRHSIWSLAIVSIFMIPLFSQFLPSWNVPILQKFTPVPESATLYNETKDIENVSTGQPNLGTPGESAEVFTGLTVDKEGFLTRFTSSFRSYLSYLASPLLLLLLWTAGFIFCTFRLMFALANTHGMVKRSRPVENQALMNSAERCSAELGLDREINIVICEETSVPMTWGLFRSSVVLPVQANSWDEKRFELVLCHELSHIKRRDFVSNLAAQIVSCVNWFNPFVWYALRQQFLEREKACDEMVLSFGVKPTEYAQNLLEIARLISSGKWLSPVEVALARKSNLEERIMKILNTNPKTTIKRSSQLLTASVGLLYIVSLACFAPVASKSKESEEAVIEESIKTLEEEAVVSEAEIVLTPIIKLEPDIKLRTVANLEPEKTMSKLFPEIETVPVIPFVPQKITKIDTIKYPAVFVTIAENYLQIKSTVKLKIREDGTVMINDEVVPLSDLKSIVKLKQKDNEKVAVLVDLDTNVELKVLTKILKTIRELEETEGITLQVVSPESALLPQPPPQIPDQEIKKLPIVKIQVEPDSITIYIDPENGSDVTGDGTKEKPYKSMEHAIEAAQLEDKPLVISRVEGGYLFVIKDELFYDLIKKEEIERELEKEMMYVEQMLVMREAREESLREAVELRYAMLEAWSMPVERLTKLLQEQVFVDQTVQIYQEAIDEDLRWRNEPRLRLESKLGMEWQEIEQLGTIMNFDLPKEGEVIVEIHIVNGDLVRSYPPESYDKGLTYFFWDGKNNDGNSMEAGTYIMTISFKVEGLEQSKRIEWKGKK